MTGRLCVLVCAIVLAMATTARAQDAAAPPPDPCAQQGAAQPAADEDATGTPPVVWTSWDLRASVGSELLDPPATVRALFEDVMETHHALTASAKCDITDAGHKFGYEVFVKEDDATGRATLVLTPLVVVRRLDISGVPWYRPAIKDELTRRLRIRVGDQLVYETLARHRQLAEEADRLRQYLQDEGFFDAKVSLAADRTGVYGATLEVHVDLGASYQVGVIALEPPDKKFAFSKSEIDEVFVHCRLHLFGRCRWYQRFTHTQYQADIQRLIEMYQKRDYPAARVHDDTDFQTMFDRASDTVDLQLRIDERRRLVVEFEGNDPDSFPDDDLRGQLTFDSAGSTDDLEVAASALKLQQYYQQRGWFDAAVSWEVERKHFEVGSEDQSFDLVRYRIDEGKPRTVRAVEIVGEHALTEDEIRGVVSTRAAGGSFRLIGGTASATRAQLDSDAKAIVALYRSRGYLDAKVGVHAAPTEDALGDPARTAAMLAADAAPGDLYVRFSVDEGDRTVLETIAITFEGDHIASEGDVREQLGLAPDAPYLLADLQRAGSRLQDWYAHLGYPRAVVTLDVTSRDPHHVTATFHVDEREQVHIGSVIVRGNFRTSNWVVTKELGFDHGAVLTDDLYARGVARLRATGLFSSIRVETPDLDDSRAPNTNVVVHVVEANDVRVNLDAEGGYSDLKSLYVKLAAQLPNPFHDGISIEASGTCGGLYNWPVWSCPVTQAVDGDIKFPRWVTRDWYVPAAPDVSLSGFYRVQETQRFGTLKASGASIAASRVWQRDNEGGRSARSLSATLHFDFRHRNIEVDAVRVAGNAGSVTQSSLSNNTGSVGLDVTWDQRVDAHGNLNPLSPDHGFKAQAGVSIAPGPALGVVGGQDAFVKLDAIGQYITPLTSRLQLKIEGRFDDGIPLGGAVLLPEVERFFAGGDDTVRGFPQDRLATEVIEQPLPPFGDIHQVEVLPAGGNIRMLGSVDLQVKLWRWGSIPIASAIYVDAGAITNTFAAFGGRDVRPSIGIALPRILTPVGGLSFEWAVPMFPRAVDPPLGRYHIIIALRY